LISRQFYTHVFNTFQPKNAKVLFAEYKGQLIAGAVFLLYKDSLYYWDGVSYSYGELRRFSSNNLIIWELIEWASKNGFKIFDMVGAQVPGIAKFKASFGGDLVAYPYLHRSTSLFSSVGRALYKRFVHGS
jgi:lipid II:glycine glycyltransferase (peptidoglycan interpeptide bridge formation enzyme)